MKCEGICDQVVGMDTDATTQGHSSKDVPSLQDSSSKDSSSSEDMGDGVEKEDGMEDGGKLTTPKKFNLAEPKYRFANRRRPGSILSISKKDFHLLSQGKSI